MSSNFEISFGTRIESVSNTYIVQVIPHVDKNGGVSTICRDGNNEMYYVKCIHKRFLHRYKQEAVVLLYLNELFPNEEKFVKIFETFDYGDWFCFALEKLDTTLLNFVERQENKRLNINDIRSIAQQILSALNTLKQAGITHTNITAKNIELLKDSLHIKLNGFSSAGRTSELSKMEVPINCGFSAPEILINSPLDESADVWSVGCLLAQLCFGASLFPTFCEYEYMKMIVKVLGPPKKTVLDQGLCTQQFFKQGPDWSLKAPEEYPQKKTRGFDQRNKSSFDYLDSLDQLLQNLPENADSTDNEDMKSFVDLLKKMLRFDPKDRISAADALIHEFFLRMQDDSSSAEGFTLDVDAVIKYESDVYRCDEVLSCGSFGNVGKFRKLETKQVFAIKMFTEKNHFEQEVKTLHLLSELGLQKRNIITYIDSFPYKDRYFILLDLLDLDLNEFMKRRNYTPLRVSEIRPFAEQLFVALRALKDYCIVHLDIKPGHIMLVNQDSQPFQLKLIDFREAQSTQLLSKFYVAQNGQYSAPEMFLGVPLDEGVDMWGVGCVLAILSLGRDLFPCGSEYEVLRDMIKLLGLPDESSLTTGRRVKDFFKWSPKISEIVWTLKTPAEFILDGGETDENSLPHFDDFASLENVLTVESVKRKLSELEDFASFVDLLKKILVMNQVDRILPADALRHPFITKESLPVCSSSHVNEKELDDSKNKAVRKFFLDRGAVIKYESDVYRCDKILECGSFGVLSKFKKLGTKLKVAVKMITEESYFQKELKALQLLRDLDQKDPNIITYIACFPYEGSFFVISELLDLNLLNFMKSQDYSPLRVSEIRPIAQQLFAALRALKSIGITHLDIKPSNIMLVNHDSQSYDVKLIDFAMACRIETLSTFDIVQNKQYRAPEVFLGLPYDEGLDMWSVGCVLAFLSLGRDLFPPESQYEVLRVIIKLFGLPDERSLAEGWRVHYFFDRSRTASGNPWTFKTPAEYVQESEETVEECWPHFDASTSLEDLITIESEESNTPEMEDLTSFIDLLKRVLAMNSADRILPEDGLKHPFITMEHLPRDSSSNYVTEAYQIAGSQNTKPASSKAENDDSDLTESSEEMETPALTVNKGVKLFDKSTVYKVEEIIGSGSNRLVTKCRKVGTDEIVVIKVFQKENHLAAINEVCDINRLSILGANKNSLPTFIDDFIYKDCICLVFELLHLNLCDFLQRQRWKPMSVANIRLIALQMLIVLRTLKRFGLTHADIKPSNIMLVNHESQPFKVKLIGLGLALETATLSEFAKVQAVGYRAPEVYMGLPYDESIDMWSLGCTLVFMYLAKHLFPEDEYNVMRLIVKCCGMPGEDALEKGERSRDFFKLTERGNSSYHWMLKTEEEYEEDEETTIPTLHPFYECLQSLDDLVKMAPDTQTLNEKKEIKAFVELVKRMLKLNPADRILPDDALKHPFFSMGTYPRSFASCVSEAREIQPAVNLTNPDTCTEVKNAGVHSDLTDSKEEMETSTLNLKKGVKLIDESNVYIIEEVTGSESFGEVVRCRQLGKRGKVEIKLFRKENHSKGIKEMNDCNLNPRSKNRFKFTDCFIYKDCFCLVCEPKT